MRLNAGCLRSPVGTPPEVRAAVAGVCRTNAAIRLANRVQAPVGTGAGFFQLKASTGQRRCPGDGSRSPIKFSRASRERVGGMVADITGASPPKYEGRAPAKHPIELVDEQIDGRVGVLRRD